MAISSEKRSAPSNRDKVDFLSTPESYPEHTNAVSVIQTHHAWVFLTDKFAYKMKKPFRRGRADHSLDRRHRLCSEEYRLNQELASNIYLGVVPLIIDDDGRLRLEGSGHIVEWLVKMRRLSGEYLLDKAGPAGLATPEDIDRLMHKLLRFYRRATECRVDPDSYASRLRREISNVGGELVNPDYDFPPALVDDVVDLLMAYVGSNEALLDRRQQEGYVREVHGDLRPEHVCLVPDADPEILDRLEFDADLRCLDCVEELAYFGLECRMIDQRWIERACIEWYRSHSGDAAPAHLWHFYAARRATVRTMLCGWHMPDSGEVEPWLSRGLRYLSFAKEHLGRTKTGA